MARADDISADTDPQPVTIDGIGHQGDGYAVVDDRELYVPFTAPGDRVRIRNTGKGVELAEILATGPERVAPCCSHFGDCGGCVLQHLSDDFVSVWKRRQVESALAHRGLRNVNIRPTLTIPAGTRRRAAFTVQRAGASIQIGFLARRSNRLTSISECPVLSPDIMHRLPAFAELGEVILSSRASSSATKSAQPCRVTVNQTVTGLDVAVEGARELTVHERSDLGAIAQRYDFARLSVNGETITMLREPIVRFGGVSVVPPPAAFLQASREGENALVALVHRALGSAIRVADLFAGCGTFAFPVAKKAKVLAVEGNGSMAAAIDRAVRQSRNARPVETETRDLFRRPLTPAELAEFDAVILDPPKAGGSAQAKEIAASRVTRVASVSCEPATFARDARQLVDGGFELKWVVPVDQFRWSARIELVGLFERCC